MTLYVVRKVFDMTIVMLCAVTIHTVPWHKTAAQKKMAVAVCLSGCLVLTRRLSMFRRPYVREQTEQTERS